MEGQQILDREMANQPPAVMMGRDTKYHDSDDPSYADYFDAGYDDYPDYADTPESEEVK